MAPSLGERFVRAYRLAVHIAHGRFLVEHFAFYDEKNGRIGWMRCVCSGWRPAE